MKNTFISASPGEFFFGLRKFLLKIGIANNIFHNYM